MTRRGSFGICESCGERKGKAAMLAHLKKCLAKQGHASGSPSSQMLLVRAQASGVPLFWLDLAVKLEAKLKEVDRLLRRVWLECCGHLSQFYTGARHKVSMNTNVGDAFGRVGSRLGYVYDFGSSTELIASLSGVVEGNSRYVVQVAARNEPLTWPCDECGQPATAVCAQCAYEGKGFCCSKHGSSHDCGEEMLLPVVNSPRMGVCGYTGEA